MGELQAGHGGDLQPVEFHPCVAAVAGVVGDGDLAPRQGGELVWRLGWLAFTSRT
jgi:hypothetical protein